MEKEFLLKEEYQTWLRDVKKLKSCDNYVSDIKSIDKNAHQFVQEYLYYVPALLFTGERVLAKQLLACVYADVWLYHSFKASYLKKYCEYIASTAKRLGKSNVHLDASTLQEIKDYLDNRQVWVVEDKMARSLKAIGGDNASTFNELFNIRIYSWGRPNFPLDIIKKVIKNDNYMSDWVGQIRNCIEVVIEESGKRTKLNNIKAFDFQKKEKTIYAIEKQGISHPVFTPLADSDNYKKMEVNNLGDISIDHEYPLDAIVKSIARGEGSELQKILFINSSNKDYDVRVNLPNIDKDKLKVEMTNVRKATSYVLMDKGENSKKNNYTSFKQVIPVNKGFKYIVADKVISEDGHTYRIYFTDKDKTMRLEKMNDKE